MNDIDVSNISVGRPIRMYKNFLGLSYANLLSLVCIEVSKKESQKVYDMLSKNDKDFKFGNKKYLLSLYNPKGTSFSKSGTSAGFVYSGHVRAVDHMFGNAMSLFDACKFMDICDIVDEAIDSGFEGMIDMMTDGFMSAGAKKYKEMAFVYNSINKMYICRAIVEKLSEMETGETGVIYTSYLCKDPQIDEYRLSSMEISSTPICDMLESMYSIMVFLACKQNIEFVFSDDMDEKRMYVSKRISSRDIIYKAAASVGIDLRERADSRTYHDDSEALKRDIDVWLQSIESKE